MAKLPTKTADRISAGIKRFQPILAAAKSRDVGESDTVTIVVDILADIFGYDKYESLVPVTNGFRHQRIPVTSPTDWLEHS